MLVSIFEAKTLSGAGNFLARQAISESMEYNLQRAMLALVMDILDNAEHGLGAPTEERNSYAHSFLSRQHFSLNEDEMGRVVYALNLFSLTFSQKDEDMQHLITLALREMHNTTSLGCNVSQQANDKGAATKPEEKVHLHVPTTEVHAPELLAG